MVELFAERVIDMLVVINETTVELLP